jgi:hypothetical protein
VYMLPLDVAFAGALLANELPFGRRCLTPTLLQTRDDLIGCGHLPLASPQFDIDAGEPDKRTPKHADAGGRLRLPVLRPVSQATPRNVGDRLGLVVPIGVDTNGEQFHQLQEILLELRLYKRQFRGIGAAGVADTAALGGGAGILAGHAVVGRRNAGCGFDCFAVLEVAGRRSDEVRAK